VTPSDNGGFDLDDYVIEHSTDSGVSWTTVNDGLGLDTSYTVTGLTNGISYIFRVKAHTAEGYSPYSTSTPSIKPRTNPGAPRSLTGEYGNKSAALTWLAPLSDGGSAITDYVIQLSSNNGTTWNTFADGTSDSTTATVTGLTNGTSYVFRVKSENSEGDSVYTAASSPVTPHALPTPPVAPTAVKGNAQVTLSWPASDDDGGAAITDYVIEYSSNDGTSWTIFADGVSDGRSATVTGLTNGTSYILRVSAITTYGTGDPSPSSDPVTPLTVPSVPKSLSASYGNASADLSWIAPTDDGGTPVTDYVIEYSSNGGTSWSTFNDGSGLSVSTTVTGLTNGTSYTFRVRAKNTEGQSQPSDTAGPLTPRTKPGAPTSLSGTKGNAQVALSWTAPSSNGGAVIDDYEIDYSSDNGTTWNTFADGTSDSTTATVTGLTNGTSYKFRVRAHNSEGASLNSNLTPAIKPLTVPSAPSITTTVSGNEYVDLVWSVPTSDGGTPITDYSVEYSADAGITWGVFADEVLDTPSATVTGLTNGTFYVFRVRALNAEGFSPYSSSSAQIRPRTTPSAPTDVVGVYGDKKVTVSWTAPDDESSHRP